MIAKTLSGIDFFDSQYGGIYSGRSLLVSGRAGTGKTTLALQFIRQGLRQDERCLMLSTMPANDLTICAEALGFSLAMDIDRGHLILLEYQSFIPGRGFPDQDMLPSEGFEQLREIIDANTIHRIVLDTVLPWISVKTTDRMAEHVFSFVRSLDRLGVTTLMTIPKPVSSMAFRLKKAVEDVSPVSILLSPVGDDHTFSWQVVKYLGEKKLGPAILYTIEPGTGIVPAREDRSATASANDLARFAVAGPAGIGTAAIELPDIPLQPSFAAAGLVPPIQPPSPPPASARPPTPSSPVRFASVWLPEESSQEKTP